MHPRVADRRAGIRPATLLAVIALAGAVAPAAPAHAQSDRPTPQELWEAYPLEPQRDQSSGERAVEPTVQAQAPQRSGSPAASAAAPAEDGGNAVLLSVGLAALAAIAVGFGVVVHRREREPTPAPAGDVPPTAEPPTASAPIAVPPRRRRRFERERPWDAAATDWTCEIGWGPGYAHSCFRAMVAPPGRPRRHEIAEAPQVRWPAMTDPTPPSPTLVASLLALMVALSDAGWERVEPGREWYAQRFVWAGAGEPPSSISVAPPQSVASRETGA